MAIRPHAQALGITTRQINDGVRHLWTIDTVLQKWLYRWLIIGVTTDFLFEWILGILSDPKVDCNHGGRFRSHQALHVVGHGGWGSGRSAIVDYAVNGCSTNDGFNVQVPEGKFLIVYAATAKASNLIHGDETEAQLGFQVGNTGPQFGYSTRGKMKFFETSTHVASADIEGPGGVNLRALALNNSVDYTEIVVFCVQSGD